MTVHDTDLITEYMSDVYPSQFCNAALNNQSREGWNIVTAQFHGEGKWLNILWKCSRFVKKEGT